MAEETITRTIPAPFIEALGKTYGEELTSAIGGLKGLDVSRIYGPQFVAPSSALTQQAEGLAGGLGAYQPFLQAAQTQVQAGPTAYRQFMSPYQQDIIDTSLRQFDIQAQKGLPGLAAQAIGAGAYGGGREGVQRAEYQTQSDLNRASLLAQLQQQGFSQAQQLAQQNLANQLQVGQAGQAQGQLASTNQALALADINARATLGEQERTIAQNKELFPLSNLSTLSTILRGYNVPTSTKTTAEMSPLSALAGVAAGGVGLFTPGVGGKTPFDNIKAAMKSGSNANFDLGSGLSINADGSISGGTFSGDDSGLSNDDLFAQTMGYRNAFDMYASGSVDNDANFYGD